MKSVVLDFEALTNSGTSNMSEDVSEQLCSCSGYSLITFSNILTIDSAALMVSPSPTGSKFGSIRCREGMTHS